MTTTNENAKKSLFGISDDFAALDALLAEVGGDVSDDQTWQAVEAWIAENLRNAGDKLDAYYQVIAEREARAEAQKVEAGRLMDQARAGFNEAERLRERLKAFMLEHGMDELTGTLHKAKLAKASDKKKLIIDDEKAIPDTHMYPKFLPDKEKIESDLASGIAVDGCRLAPVARSLRLT